MRLSLGMEEIRIVAKSAGIRIPKNGVVSKINWWE